MLDDGQAGGGKRTSKVDIRRKGKGRGNLFLYTGKIFDWR